MRTVYFLLLWNLFIKQVFCRVTDQIGADNRDRNVSLLSGLPNGIELFESQVAGHTFKKDENGMLKDRDGFILKAVCKPVCGPREMEFYEHLMSNMSDPSMDALRTLVPEYRGIVNILFHGKNINFIKLKDITHDMDEPCVLDIKVGKQTWDPVATPEKIEKEKKSYKLCKESLGFCVQGFQVYDIKTGNIRRYGKDYGRKLDHDSAIDALKMFLNGDAQLSSLLLTKFLSALQPIHEWLYASSLLLTYDAKRLKDQMQCYRNNSSTFNSMDECNVAGAREWVFVKMIDFAHAFPAEDESIDTNYLFGINNLVNIFTEFLRESQM